MIFAAIADWADSNTYDVSFMCAELGVSTSGYYAWRNRGPSVRQVEDETLLEVIKAEHKDLDGNPGVRRTWAELTAQGWRISAKRVHRLMRVAGLQGRHPKA
ncbi:IS3 family transposase [Arthrobacter sp. A5]|uniref:IS3 family transposase n=1 Tax=Arthrobacter sp. A5 TaxID=576926 RepID=UPI003DA9A437